MVNLKIPIHHRNLDVRIKAVDNEFNLIELNLFVSSIGKDKIEESTEKVKKLREKVDSGKLDLSEYEDMAEDF
ncbi:MAG: hypothetical protein AABX30_01180 [Nanoarchaeota archaeon]